MQLDMTKGNPLKLIITFIVPVLCGNIFQQLYNMADTIIVGRFVGFEALGAVGATGTIMFLILGFSTGLTSGFTVITAQKFGAGDYDGVKVSVFNALFLSLFVTAIMTAISVLGMPSLLRIMNTPDDIFRMSYNYIIVICGGLTFTIFYNIMASLLRAVGNSKAPLYFLIISASLNIGLDLLLIKAFHLGVTGASLATIISQGISGILCALYTMKHVPMLIPSKKQRKLNGQCIKNQLTIGIPMALQFSITAVGTIMVQAALNNFGSTVIASYTAAGKVSQLMTLPYTALGVTMATYAAQNRGINDIERIRKGVRVSTIMNVVYSLIIYAVAIAALAPLMKLFIDTSSLEVSFETVFGYGRIYMLISGTCFIPLGEIFILRNAMQGCGFSLMPMLGGVVELISRAIISTIATSRMSFKGVCAADPITWLVTAIFLVVSYIFTARKMRLDKSEFAQTKG